MGKEDYIKYLCAVGYNSSGFSQLVGQVTACSSTRPSVLDMNLPSITIRNLRENINLTRSVTKVGPVNAVYKAHIDPPLGISVAVRPDTLVFNSAVKTIMFTVEVSTTHRVNTGYYFGSLTWIDGEHVVTSALSVRTRIPYYTEE
ncbi:subtilisin-like protease SBT3.3 [Pyrus x bretschneideri]|uniref:subtilisin-like protease SBT3.3 n=1 Tax=Pyrus x bretschneideri TaxID=225117 RepID=UPI00202EEFA6|nr:subtilisin-like protease SBT3.3 [Pyrus x bretschneideri]